jgi:hypothetical protein
VRAACKSLDLPLEGYSLHRRRRHLSVEVRHARQRDGDFAVGTFQRQRSAQKLKRIMDLAQQLFRLDVIETDRDFLAPCRQIGEQLPNLGEQLLDLLLLCPGLRKHAFVM